jgi:hypothetical protein
MPFFSLLRVALLTSFLSFQRGLTHSLTCFSLVGDRTICYLISSSTVLLMILQDALSFRHSCCLVPWSFVPVLHSRPFMTASIMPAGTTWQVICPWAANFQDPLLPWLHSCSYRQSAPQCSDFPL